MSSLERISRPWSIRGVLLEARTRAAKAAARRRMTLGEWVTNALLRTANDELGEGWRDGEGRVAIPAAAPVVSKLGQAVTQLEERLGTDGRRDGALYAIGRYVAETERRSDRTMTLLAKIAEADGGKEALVTLAEQFESHRHGVDAKLDLIARAVSAIGEQMGSLHRRMDASLELEARTLAAVSATLLPLQRLAMPAPRAAEPQPAPAPEPQAAAPADVEAEQADFGAETAAPQAQIPAPSAPRIDFATLHTHAVENSNRDAAQEPTTGGTRFFGRLFSRKDGERAA